MTKPTFHDKTFAEQIVLCRKAKKMSQTDLAVALVKRGLSIHQQTIGKIERGSRLVSLGEACLIADVLGVSLASMTGFALWPSTEHIARIADLERVVTKAMAVLGGAS